MILHRKPSGAEAPLAPLQATQQAAMLPSYVHYVDYAVVFYTAAKAA